jgi:orotidine-5'-phosphate decarboxylase
LAITAVIIVAFDYDHGDKALAMADRLDPDRCHIKVGKQLFTCAGPELVQRLQGQGFKVFLDLKFHDIPNTVAKALTVAAELGVWMVNVHASGGLAMMTAARQALQQCSHQPLLIGVTVLTSMDAVQLRQIGIHQPPAERVVELARLARQAGLDGVVCSAREVPLLRRQLGSEFQLVTPGIRPATAASGDQKRIMTPAAAQAAGSDYLVIGRPITGADDPLQALGLIEKELNCSNGH